MKSVQVFEKLLPSIEDLESRIKEDFCLEILNCKKL